MRAPRFILLAGLALGIAGCNTGDVPKERLPRFEPPHGPAPRVALVLGSGGPRGFLNLMDFFEFRQLGGGLSSGAAVQEYVNKRLHEKAIEQLNIPFAAAATRVSDGKLALFNHGDTGLAVRASGASPGQFEPVRVGDETYLDGDEASPVPIHVARALGAKVVIAVDVSAYAKDTPATALQEWIVKDERRARQIAAEAPEADIVLHPNIGYYAGHTDAYRRNVIAIAERDTREKLPAIQAALARAGLHAAQNAAIARKPEGDASR